MVELKRICGIVLLGFALLFVFRIPNHLHSPDLHQQSLAHVDYFLIFVLGGCGLLLLFSRGPTPGGVRKRKQIKPSVLAVQGLGLIVFICVVSFRNIVLYAGKTVVTGQVVAVDQPATRPSGKTTYHLSYQYTDMSGVTRNASDVALSSTPLILKSPIEVAYSSYWPSISRVSSRVSNLSVYLIFIGVFYEFWALFLFVRRKRMPDTP